MQEAEPKISWTDVRKFVGQLNHDLRNHLNALELQAAFLNDIVEQPEAKEELKRLRNLTSEAGAQLQALSGQMAKIQVNPMHYQATEFVEDLRASLVLAAAEEAAGIQWKVSLGAEKIEVDPLLLQEAFLELFRNAFAHDRGQGALVCEARATGEKLEFTLREPKAKFEGATEEWGQRPLGRVRHGHYSLGLFRARGIFEAHHGTLRAQFDPATSVLVTTVVLPLASEESDCSGGL
jgi:light-regulated signal transduction histidine kinase (bacteriophytochrome)